MNRTVKDIPVVEVIEFIRELGLNPDKVEGYTTEDIKKAYRKKAKEAHPDTGGSEEAFHRVLHAYNMLTNPQYRFKNARSKIPFNLNIDLKVPCSFEDAFFGRMININMSTIKATDKGIWDLEKAQKDGKTTVEVKTFNIKLPPGCVGGYKTRIQGKGIQVGDAIGDCYVQVLPNPKPGVMVRGPDVFSQVQVPLSTMLKGGEISVLTMFGLRKTWVPPGSKPESHIEIKRCGVSRCGSHFAILYPIFPTTEDLKDKDWQKLGIDWKEHQKRIDKENKEDEAAYAKFSVDPD